MLCAAQIIHAFNSQKIASNSIDAGTHPVEHFAKLLDVGFAGGIVNGGFSIRHNRRHNKIGGTRDRRFIHEQESAFQVWRDQMKKAIFSMIVKRSPQSFKIHNVRVKSPSSYLVAAGLGNKSFSEACEHRPGQHHGSPEPPTFFSERFAVQIIYVDIIGLENARVLLWGFNFHTHFPE